MHVKKIQEVVDTGDYNSAYDHLDALLELGPNNIEALKLKAELYEAEGRFDDASGVWEKIAGIDREDEEAINFLLRQQLEDREHFHFTDDLPGGGRRYLTYPRRVIQFAAFGFTGCLAFLVYSRLAANYEVLNHVNLMFVVFGLFIILPWLGIVASYLHTVRWISVNHKGLEINSRLKTRYLRWPDIEKVCLARHATGDDASLSLIIIPKDRTEKAIAIDLNLGSTLIRARTYFVREISRYFHEPELTTQDELGLHKKDCFNVR